MKAMLRVALSVMLWSALVASGLSERAVASLIVNGDFETFVPSNGTGGGWTSSNIDGSGGWRVGGGNPGAMFILNDNGNAPDPTIEQLVTGLTVGATYRLTGDYANEYLFFGSRGPDTFAVDVDGVTLDKLDFPGVGVFGSFSFDIVALDTDLLIAFRAEIDGDDTDYKIDNISLVRVTAVPEPTSIFSMLSVTVFVGLRYWRRKGSGRA